MQQNRSTPCSGALLRPLLSIVCATNAVSFTVCLSAAILVFVLRLYRKVVYRLALYQVLSSLGLAALSVAQIGFINYSEDQTAYTRACKAIAFLSLYIQWTMLLFTMWTIQHLFCFGALQNNLRKCEVLYALTSLLLPAAIAAVALLVGSYGLGDFGCWIYPVNGDLAVDCAEDVVVGNLNASAEKLLFERFGFWDGPASAILLAASVAMVVMMIKLSCKACQRKRYRPIAVIDDQFGKAFKQLLPLVAFPILFYAAVIQQFAFHIYQFFVPQPPKEMVLFTAVSFAVGSAASGLALIIHICVARIYRKELPHREMQVQGAGERAAPLPPNYGSINDDRGFTTIRRETRSLTANSATYFSLPITSLDGAV